MARLRDAERALIGWLSLFKFNVQPQPNPAFPAPSLPPHCLPASMITQSPFPTLVLQGMNKKCQPPTATAHSLFPDTDAMCLRSQSRQWTLHPNLRPSPSVRRFAVNYDARPNDHGMTCEDSPNRQLILSFRQYQDRPFKWSS